jgi:hypothetical protein
MFVIEYTLKLTTFVKATLEMHYFTRTEQFEVNKNIEEAYNNEILLKAGNILNYFENEIKQYLEENWLTIEQIEVETYEVISNTPGVEVYFKNPEGDNLFTLSPNLIGFVVKPPVVIPVPTNFKGTLIDDTTIQWTWDADSEAKYGHFLLNDKGEIIAQIPVSIHSYIESLLEYDTNYTRMLVKYNDEGTSEPAGPITVKTNEKKTVPSNLKRYIIKPRDEYSEEILEKVTENIEAFQSGIGHGLDLMVDKTKDDTFHTVFTLSSYLYGTRTYQEPVYGPIPFNYSITAKGEKPELHKEGSVRFVLSAYKFCDIDISSVGKIYEPIDVKWRAGVDISYEYVDPAKLQALQSQVDEYYEIS